MWQLYVEVIYGSRNSYRHAVQRRGHGTGDGAQAAGQDDGVRPGVRRDRRQPAVTPPGAGPVLVALLQFLGEWNDLLTALPFPPRQVRTSGLTMGADQ